MKGAVLRDAFGNTYSRGLIDSTGAVPDLACGLGYTAPTYFCRFLGSIFRRSRWPALFASIMRFWMPHFSSTLPVKNDPLSGEAGTGGAEAKRLIRKSILALRDSHNAAWRATASQAIALQVMPLLHHLPQGPVAAYWPYKSEADPLPALEALVAGNGRQRCLPVIAHPHMRFLQFVPGEPMEEAGFGTLGPRHDAPELRPTTLLVPLAAFDDQCQRIGWGKGHYDRAIERLYADGSPLITIGIAFSFQQTALVPVEPHDRPLDYVATEDRLFTRRT
jgi:5-formyltetrahydrofolate cyclo-ligase